MQTNLCNISFNHHRVPTYDHDSSERKEHYERTLANHYLALVRHATMLSKAAHQETEPLQKQPVQGLAV